MLRAGQQLVHIVQQHIQSLLVDGAAAEHGGDEAVLDALAHSLDDLLGGECLAAEELLHQLVVGLGDGLAHGLDQALEAVTDVGQVHLHLLAALILEGFWLNRLMYTGVPSSSLAGTTQGQTVAPNFIFMSSRILK